MSVVKQEFSVPSCDGIHTLSGVVFLPQGEAKGLFQVVHGMTEHIKRYEAFMTDLAKEGWLCFGYDNLGHGNTARTPEELGYIAHKKGWELLARDVRAYADAVLAHYGRPGMPYTLMGHSMGSFIVRLAAERYVHPDRLIIMGTGGSNPAAGAGLALIGMIKAFRGEHHVSPLVETLAFGSYNDRFGGGSQEDPKPWLTNDAAVRQVYYADPFCTFPFTVSAMGDLIRLMKYVNRSTWFKRLPEALPILLVSGEEDPVGNYGKGVCWVRDRLQKAGRSVTCRLYPGARHEILNDFTYEAVKGDILDFCR